MRATTCRTDNVWHTAISRSAVSHTSAIDRREGAGCEICLRQRFPRPRPGLTRHAPQLRNGPLTPTGGRDRAASLSVYWLDAVFDGATEAKQYSAAGRAVEAQARIAGVGAADRIEIGGPGSFSEPTVAETLQMVAREFGSVTASALAWTLDHDDGDMPVDDVARFTLATMTLDEALVRHEQLREALLKAASDGAVLVETVPKDVPPRDTVDDKALAILMQPKRRRGRAD